MNGEYDAVNVGHVGRVVQSTLLAISTTGYVHLLIVRQMKTMCLCRTPWHGSKP